MCMMQKTGMCRRELENHIVHALCHVQLPKLGPIWTNLCLEDAFLLQMARKNPWKCQPFSTPSKASKTSHTVAAVPVPMVSLRLVTQNVVPHYLLLGASRLNKTLVCLVVLYLLYMFINFSLLCPTPVFQVGFLICLAETGSGEFHIW